MILFVVLVLTLFILAVFAVAAVSVGGALAIIVFGDVIVCAVLLVWLLRHLIVRRKR